MGMVVFVLLLVALIWWYGTRARKEEEGRVAAQAEQERLVAEAQAVLDEVNELPQLPAIETGFALQRGEVCHWAGTCSWHEVRTRTTRINYRGPTVSIPIMKGVRYRMGSITPSVERMEELVPIDRGVLFITNKRLVFDGESKNSVVTFKSLLRVGFFPGGFQAEKQTGKSPYLFIGDEGARAYAIASRALTQFVGPAGGS